MPEDLLCPLGLALTSKDPAAHVFGLQHENAKRRQKHMIDLGSAIGRIQCDVVQPAVDLAIQPIVGKCPHQQLTEPALEPGRLDDDGQDQQWQQPHQHVEQRLEHHKNIHRFLCVAKVCQYAG